jgi:hypothetical protein
VNDATSIFGSYETREGIVRGVQLSLLAIVKQAEEPTSYEMAELVTDLIIIPLLTEFHE